MYVIFVNKHIKSLSISIVVGISEVMTSSSSWSISWRFFFIILGKQSTDHCSLPTSCLPLSCQALFYLQGFIQFLLLSVFFHPSSHPNSFPQYPAPHVGLTWLSLGNRGNSQLHCCFPWGPVLPLICLSHHLTECWSLLLGCVLDGLGWWWEGSKYCTWLVQSCVFKGLSVQALNKYLFNAA